MKFLIPGFFGVKTFWKVVFGVHGLSEVETFCSSVVHGWYYECGTTYLVISSVNPFLVFLRLENSAWDIFGFTSGSGAFIGFAGSSSVFFFFGGGGGGIDVYDVYTHSHIPVTLNPEYPRICEAHQKRYIKI